MEIINAREITDEHWRSYAELDKNISKKYFPEETYNMTDWREIKRNRLTDLDLLKEDRLVYFLFFENDKAAGWLGIRLSGDEAEFEIEVMEEEIPADIMKRTLELVHRFMSDNNRTGIKTYSCREGITGSLIKAGGVVIDRKVYSRIMKDELNTGELQRIVDSIGKKINYDLVLYDTIPEEILDRYVEIYNQARIDMNRFNPAKPEIKKRTRKDVIKKLKWDKGPRDKMYMYMLFDKENIAAFCSLFIRDENKHMVDQAGGLTTVGRNYRGLGLARYLKAKMYLKMLEAEPDFEFIRTDTYPWNKYMFRINQEMGFKVYREYSETNFV